MASQADVDAILDAIAGGQQRVRFADGRDVWYRSVAEMQQALAVIRGELDALDPVSYSSFRRD